LHVFFKQCNHPTSHSNFLTRMRGLPLFSTPMGVVTYNYFSLPPGLVKAICFSTWLLLLHLDNL